MNNKCCGKETHGDICAQFWHLRYRREVEKRVDLENTWNKELLAHESEVAGLKQVNNSSLMSMAHAWALDFDQFIEAMKRFGGSFL